MTNEEFKKTLWDTANKLRGFRSFTQLRDTLLPCLISGKLRLPDVEALLVNAPQSSYPSKPAEVVR